MSNLWHFWDDTVVLTTLKTRDFVHAFQSEQSFCLCLSSCSIWLCCFYSLYNCSEGFCRTLNYVNVEIIRDLCTEFSVISVQKKYLHFLHILFKFYLMPCWIFIEPSLRTVNLLLLRIGPDLREKMVDKTTCFLQTLQPNYQVGL